MKPTQNKLKGLFSYDKETGTLLRKQKIRGCKFPKGSEVGATNSHGYGVVRVDNQLLGVHRVIWCMVYGYYPENVIDHINHDKKDNRLENLREATIACNIKNHNGFNTNKSGVTGVCWDTKKGHWIAFVSIRNVGVEKRRRVVHLIRTEDFIEAVCYRLAAEQCLEYPNNNSDRSAATYLNNKTSG